jgi:hypothetical protein
VNGVFFITHIKILPKGIYFATIKEKDGPNDKASELNRAKFTGLVQVFQKPAYEKLFGKKPARIKCLVGYFVVLLFFKKYLSSNRCFIPYLIELAFERKYNLTQVHLTYCGAVLSQNLLPKPRYAVATIAQQCKRKVLYLIAHQYPSIPSVTLLC